MDDEAIAEKSFRTHAACDHQPGAPPLQAPASARHNALARSRRCALSARIRMILTTPYGRRRKARHRQLAASASSLRAPAVRSPRSPCWTCTRCGARRRAVQCSRGLWVIGERRGTRLPPAVYSRCPPLTAALSATHRPLAPMIRVLVMCENGMRGPHISEVACQMCEYMCPHVLCASCMCPMQCGIGDEHRLCRRSLTKSVPLCYPCTARACRAGRRSGGGSDLLVI